MTNKDVKAEKEMPKKIKAFATEHTIIMGKHLPKK